MPSSIQYQPLTGPVWREPVASRMAWLPAGQPRALERRNAPSEYVIPFVAAVAAATSLAWMPMGTARASVVPSTIATSVLAPFQPPATFNPAFSPRVVFGERVLPSVRAPDAFSVEPFVAALYRPDGLQWIPAGRPAVLLERRLPSESAARPFTAALYKPEGLQWQPGGSPQPRSAPPLVQTWVVFAPFPIPGAAFNPVNFPWVVSGRVLPVERRVPSEWVEPFTAALYRPEGLQWLPSGRDIPRRLLTPVQTWSLLSPIQIAAPFNPATFPWMPVTLQRLLERRWPSELVEPVTAALYRPERLEWIPRGNPFPWRTIAPNRVGWSVGDALPHASIALALHFTDASGPRFVFVDASGEAYGFMDDSTERYEFDDISAPFDRFDDVSRPREGFGDESEL